MRRLYCPHDDRGGSPVAPVLGSGATDTEEARVFLQGRLRLYAGWAFVLSFGFYGFTMIMSLAIGLPYLLHPATLWHLPPAVETGHRPSSTLGNGLT